MHIQYSFADIFALIGWNAHGDPLVGYTSGNSSEKKKKGGLLLFPLTLKQGAPYKENLSTRGSTSQWKPHRTTVHHRDFLDNPIVGGEETTLWQRRVPTCPLSLLLLSRKFRHHAVLSFLFPLCRRVQAFPFFFFFFLQKRLSGKGCEFLLQLKIYVLKSLKKDSSCKECRFDFFVSIY